jgi:hypothetical protein
LMLGFRSNHTGSRLPDRLKLYGNLPCGRESDLMLDNPSIHSPPFQLMHPSSVFHKAKSVKHQAAQFGMVISQTQTERERERERWIYLFFDTAEVNSYTESIVLNSSSSDAFWTLTQNFAHLWRRGFESPTMCKNSINNIFHHNLQHHSFVLVSHWTPKLKLGYKLNCALRHDCFLNERFQKTFSLN